MAICMSSHMYVKRAREFNTSYCTKKFSLRNTINANSFKSSSVLRLFRMSDSTDINIRLWSLSCPIVDLNLVLISFSFENTLSALHKVHGRHNTMSINFSINKLHHNINGHLLFHHTNRRKLRFSLPFLLLTALSLLVRKGAFTIDQNISNDIPSQN